jgi:hypothetical protein
MADYREVEIGYEMLQRFFHDEVKRNLFYKSFQKCAPGVGEEAIRLFDQLLTSIRFSTFIMSISEHDDHEDQHGRLSMWRGFGGGPTRAALVMRPPPIGDAEGLGLSLSPVAYFEYEEVEKQIRKVMRNIKENAEFLKSVDRNMLKDAIFYMLATAAVSLKHIGFSEEREWRVIYFPEIKRSNLIVPMIETVGGVPQMIHKIPLEENPEHDVKGVGIPSLIDRVIIGPTAYAGPMWAAFVGALQSVGVTDAAARVVLSGIPLRQS